MTASNDSITAARAAPPRGVPGRTLALLVFFLAGSAAAWLGLAHLRGRFVIEEFDVSGTPVERVRLRDRQSYPVQILLLHGYVANRRHLLNLAEVLAAAGADVFLMDLPGRGDHTGRVSPHSAGGFEAAMPTPRETRAALDVAHYLERQFGARRDRLVVLGHSMGGGVALDLGRRLLPAATIALAGLERPVGPGLPPHPLFITARLEIPALRRAADRMYAQASAGGPAARLEFLATHSSLPFHSSVQRAVVDWVNRAVPGARLSLPPRFNASLLALEAAALFFLCGLFVPLANLASWALAHEPFGEVAPETRFTLWSPVHLFGYALLAGLAAVSGLHLLRLFSLPLPLGFLRLEGGSYLASVLLLSTLWLVPALARPPWVRSRRETLATVGAALGLAAYLIVVGGGFVTLQLFDLWPTWARLVKMPLLAAVLFPYALGEELLGRSTTKAPRAPSALDALLAWRLGLLLSLLYAALVLASGERMLVVLAIPLLLLSLLEYFFSAALYRALWSPYADAALKAVLLAWIIATLFPLR